MYWGMGDSFEYIDWEISENIIYPDLKRRKRACLPFSFLFVPKDVYLNIKYKLFWHDIGDVATDRKNMENGVTREQRG